MIESIESFAYGTLLSTFVDDLIFEACIDVIILPALSWHFFFILLMPCLLNSKMMWSIRTGGCSLDEIYNVDPIDSYFVREKLNGTIAAPETLHSCPI